jgi:hypothetical protein
MNAASVIVKIKHVVWRDGQPRFVPGPKLRELGFRGRDLKHPSGSWYTLQDCQGFVQEIEVEIGQRRAQKESGKRLKAVKAQNIYTVAQLFDDLFREPKFQKAGTVRVKTLAPSTVRNYKQMSKSLQDFDEELWLSPVASVSTVVAWGLYEKLYAEKGLHMARHVIATCSMAWSWWRKRGSNRINPFKDLGMETPEGRLRSEAPATIRHFVATCDRLGRPEIGDMIMLGVFSVQRQADRLALTWNDVAGGRFKVEQGKTGKKVAAAIPAPLLARLEAAKGRRKDHKIQWPNVVIDEQARRPFKPDHYRHVFAAMRDAAAKDLPALAGFRDQDLRDTGLTWARDGGADFDTRRQLSGHSQASAALEEKHYLAQAESQGDEAVKAIEAVWEKTDDKSE